MIACDTKPQNIRAVLLCRVASASPEDSWAIYHQRDLLRDFAKRQSYEVTMEYFEDGVNGLTLNRPMLKKIEIAIKAGEIDVVIVRCIDRISRNFILAEDWKNKMQRYGAKIIAADGSHEPILPDLLVGALMQHYAEWRKQKRVSALRSKGISKS